jgi:hypothetical protein
MRKQLVIALVVATVVFIAGQQSAMADRISTNEYTINFEDIPGDLCTAYGFQIMVDAVFEFKETSFFDKHGNLVRFRVKLKITEGARPGAWS